MKKKERGVLRVDLKGGKGGGSSMSREDEQFRLGVGRES